ncbi:hypothetical protein CQW23_01810 [Capsicum baccatum]|uniref:Ubiquitin-activating enzyme SCCH domain-containing protein n=1 Tax=Capsicum baccatum TaxID=33114 RepID=A0A2G2XPN3_CAPBA|nr:hypothetical protein CQW23_01810 [Capsicum baccatum]
MISERALATALYSDSMEKRETDNDTNYHMDSIARLANMKARNYSTGEVDKLKAKFIAGRIIPAIACYYCYGHRSGLSRAL